MSADREALWIALSELWLDAELDDDRIDAIAETVRRSGCDRATLDHIYRRELAPVLHRNHRQVAGVWSGFDPDWLVREVRAGASRRALRARVADGLGRTTRSTRDDYARVVARAFPSSR